MSKARMSLECDCEMITDYETSEHNPNTTRITLVQNPPHSVRRLSLLLCDVFMRWGAVGIPVHKSSRHSNFYW